MKRNLGIIFGGRSGEHEVSLQSARSIAGAVNRSTFNIFLIAVDKKGNWYLANEDDYLLNPDDPAAIQLQVREKQQIALVPFNNSNQLIQLSSGKVLGSLDVAFPIIHGTFGEDGGLQGYFSMLNLPYVGADITGSAVAMDKLVAKKLLIQSGIPVADFVLSTVNADIKSLINKAEEKFDYPVFIKPACSGSSVGVYKASDADELEKSITNALKYDNQVLIEEAIEGREIECAILGNDELIASVPGEIIPKHSFYSYEAKYIDSEGARLEMPAQISEGMAHQVKELARKSYKALACSGMARVDMFLTSDDRLILNEINTLPGFTKISMYPKLMELTGISYSELIDRLVVLAIEKHEQREDYLKHILTASAF